MKTFSNFALLERSKYLLKVNFWSKLFWNTISILPIGWEETLKNIVVENHFEFYSFLIFEMFNLLLFCLKLKLYYQP